jgi:hypothetical protein
MLILIDYYVRFNTKNHDSNSITKTNSQVN